MNSTVRDKALALLREASSEIASARLRIEKDAPLAAFERIREAEKKLMDARHLLALVAAGATATAVATTAD